MSVLRTLVVVHALLALGCARAPQGRNVPQPLDVPPLSRPLARTDSLTVHFSEGATVPSGCFAVSRRTGAVACVVGQFAIAAESGERRLTLLSSSDEPLPDLAVRVEVDRGMLRLARPSQQALDALMRQGDFVVLSDPVLVPPDSPQTMGGLTVELRRGPTRSVEALAHEPLASQELKVIVRADAHDGTTDEVLLENTLSSVACVGPTLTVRALEPRIVLVERECRVDEGGTPEVLVSAWLCNGERARCD